MLKSLNDDTNAKWEKKKNEKKSKISLHFFGLVFKGSVQKRRKKKNENFYWWKKVEEEEEEFLVFD